MDETSFKILDTKVREICRPISIRELTKKIQELHGAAYYANIYKALHNMATHGSITLTRAGRSLLIALNFGNYLTVDLLTEMELERKRRLLARRPSLLMLLAEIDRRFSDHVRSLSLINPEKNARLNRAELLLLFQNSGDKDMIHRAMQTLQRVYNMKIDCLILSRNEFLELAKGDERTPLQEMLYNEITFLAPQAFWSEIRNAIVHGMQIKTLGDEINPAKISEKDLVYNLARFGYREFGSEIRRGENICIEYIITAILMEGDARRIDAIPIILAKSRANYNLLIFLSQKYGRSGRLLGLLRALNKVRPAEETYEAIKDLETIGAKVVKVNADSIKEKMRLYNA